MICILDISFSIIAYKMKKQFGTARLRIYLKELQEKCYEKENV